MRLCPLHSHSVQTEVPVNSSQPPHVFLVQFELGGLEVLSDPCWVHSLGDHYRATMEAKGNADLEKINKTVLNIYIHNLYMNRNSDTA